MRAQVLEGQIDEALEDLKAFERGYLNARFPDGEVALAVAEAYALLGDGPGRAGLHSGVRLRGVVPE